MRNVVLRFIETAAIICSFALLCCSIGGDVAVFADPASQCCAPGHATPTSPPAGGNASCFCRDDLIQDECVAPDTGNACKGDTNETAVPGSCVGATAPNKYCATGAQITINARSGYYDCPNNNCDATQTTDTCDCIFNVDSGGTTTPTQVANCIGDGC